MRGTGIFTKVKYKWTQQPNGKYTVFDIPIFQTFKDKKRGKLDKRDGAEIVKNFNEERTDGYYPRAHIEHQAEGSTENKTGAGFLDNLRFDGKTFFADLVEIPDVLFMQIKDLKYPYRSVEYHADKKKILSLALLESQASFFQFPILNLEEEETKLNTIQQYTCSLREQVLQFRADDDDAFCDLCGGTTKEKIKMSRKSIKKMQTDEHGPEETSPQDEAETPGLEENVEAVSFNPEEMMGQCHELLQGIDAKVSKMAEVLDMLLSGEEEEKQAAAGQQEIAPPTSSVAMQLNEISKRLRQIEHHGNVSIHASRLKAICEENPSLIFEEEVENLQKFSSDKDRKVFVDMIESRSARYPIHEASKFAQNFTRVDSNKVLAKFQQDPATMQFAKSVLKDYADTVNQRNRDAADKFVAMWPTAEKWVEYNVEMEQVAPGSYKKMFN